MTAGGNLFTLQFWKNTLELAVRGAAICGGTAIGGSAVDAWHLDWRAISGFALSGAMLSVVASLSAIEVGQKGSPLVTRQTGDG
jgi:Putative lactococcus lactis phage r1t holin